MKGQAFPIVVKQMKLESVVQLQDNLNANRRLQLTMRTNLVHQVNSVTFQSKRNPTVTSVTVDESVINVHSNLHPEVIGKRVRVKYENLDNSSDWYEGIITFNCTTGKYGVFFPCDNKTEEFFLNEEGFMIID